MLGTTEQALTTTDQMEIDMATKNVKRNPNELESTPHIGGLVRTGRKTQWIVGGDSPKTVDDLSFTARDAGGRFHWWSVEPPKTNYWHVHQMLGRAYAFEVLDLLNNPEAKDDVGDGQHQHVLGCILGAICRWQPTVNDTAASGIADGFFHVIGEYVATGTANR